MDEGAMVMNELGWLNRGLIQIYEVSALSVLGVISTPRLSLATHPGLLNMPCRDRPRAKSSG